MTKTIFSDTAAFVRAPRVTGLQTSRSGLVVATRRTIDEDGAAFVDQLFEIHADGARQLTHGAKSATLLAVGERGEVYFSREDPGAEKKGDAIWMLPPKGEAREIFRYHGGIESLAATSTNLLLTLNVLPSDGEGGVDGAGEGGANSVDSDAGVGYAGGRDADPADATARYDGPAGALLARSSEQAKRRQDGKVSAVLHERYPTRFWNRDYGQGKSRLFASPLPSLDKPIDASSKAGELTLTEVPLPPAPEDAHQWDLAGAVVSPDGTFVLATISRRQEIVTHSQVWRLDLTGGAAPELLRAEEGADISAVALAPNSRWGVVGSEIPPLPNQTVQETTFRLNLATRAFTLLTEEPWSSLIIGGDARVYVTADRRGRGGVFRVEDDGSATLITPDDDYAYGSLCWSGEELVALRSGIASPAEVVYIDPATGEVRLGPRLAPALDLPGRLEEVETVAQDGTALRAWLVLPEGDGPHPLVVFAHGGPWGSWNDWTWRWNPWVFAARGYAVLLPDPGISTGYGAELLARGHDSIGDEPFTDIMALTDATVAREDIDASRQLFAGGSYGGYMANWVATHTADRFNAIVTHASLWNIESMGRTTDNGSWYRWMMGPVEGGKAGGAPQVELWSPHRFVDQIRVPMLVIHGDKDYRVPISQGLELWFDLQRTSPDLDHQYLYYPDEGHWILKPGNAQVWYQTFLDFLDRHRERG